MFNELHFNSQSQTSIKIIVIPQLILENSQHFATSKKRAQKFHDTDEVTLSRSE